MHPQGGGAKVFIIKCLECSETKEYAKKCNIFVRIFFKNLFHNIFLEY